MPDGPCEAFQNGARRSRWWPQFAIRESPLTTAVAASPVPEEGPRCLDNAASSPWPLRRSRWWRRSLPAAPAPVRQSLPRPHRAPRHPPIRPPAVQRRRTSAACRRSAPPGPATGGSGRGINGKTIRIGVMGDPGSAAAPGLGPGILRCRGRIRQVVQCRRRHQRSDDRRRQARRANCSTSGQK